MFVVYALVLATLIASAFSVVDSACPVCHTYIEGVGPVTPPTPDAHFYLDQDTHSLCMDITAAYDPDVALVVGFSPFSRTRSLYPTACENRDNEILDEVGARDAIWGIWDEHFADSSVLLASDVESAKYPSSKHAGIWNFSVNSCNTVTYSTCIRLDDFDTACVEDSTNPFNVISASPILAYSGTVYVTYVHEDPSATNLLSAIDVPISFEVYDEISASECAQNQGFEFGNLSWIVQESSLRAEVSMESVAADPNERLCAFDLEGPIEFASSSEACDCLYLCPESYCIEEEDGDCVQNWNAQTTEPVEMGDLIGDYTAFFSKQFCPDNFWQTCPDASPNYVVCEFSITEDISVSSTFDDDQMKAVVTFVDSDIVTIRAVPIGEQCAVEDLEYVSWCRVTEESSIGGCRALDEGDVHEIWDGDSSVGETGIVSCAAREVSFEGPVGDEEFIIVEYVVSGCRGFVAVELCGNQYMTADDMAERMRDAYTSVGLEYTEGECAEWPECPDGSCFGVTDDCNCTVDGCTCPGCDEEPTDGDDDVVIDDDLDDDTGDDDVVIDDDDNVGAAFVPKLSVAAGAVALFGAMVLLIIA
ncbi:hypothetical protein KIPB_000018 [Kipferlia bialata]|uniref:Uncharacterized protein n=1 Tax=Kipferlia bialata TaxID=797122 RepID=A0A9K3CN55_9EUKA|nr:hypothetical protein KIPB_000018 [Kipferlia bialata]|eukprot:g18.t1